MAGLAYTRALVVGAGPGLSASIARRFAAGGLAIELAARDTGKLAGLVTELGATAHSLDAADEASVAALFDRLDEEDRVPDVVVYNPSSRVRGPTAELDPADVRRALEVSAFGGFLVAQQAIRRMETLGRGAILFTGASASVKGYAQSASFAMGKFALRGLAQSLARELQPQNIHVAHVVIDGGIAQADRKPPSDRPDAMLDPDAIAETYWSLLVQHRSAWAWEIELRPWVERF